MPISATTHRTELAQLSGYSFACNSIQKSRRVKGPFSLHSSWRQALLCYSPVSYSSPLSRRAGDFGPWNASWLLSCCRARGCSCGASLCHLSPGAELLRTLSAAYQPHFRGDELLLIALFKWAKHTRRSCVKLWHRLRQVVVIDHHVSVISY